MADQPEALDVDRKKTHKLQVWVGEELFAKISERCKVTNRPESAWIRAVLEKHFSKETEKRSKEDAQREELAARLDRIDKRLDALLSARSRT